MASPEKDPEWKKKEDKAMAIIVLSILKFNYISYKIRKKKTEQQRKMYGTAYQIFIDQKGQLEGITFR